MSRVTSNSVCKVPQFLKYLVLLPKMFGGGLLSMSNVTDVSFSVTTVVLSCTSFVQVPCVGVSIGIERVFSILEAKELRRKEEAKAKGERYVIKRRDTNVYVASAEKNMQGERFALCTMLWNSGISVSLKLHFIQVSNASRKQLIAGNDLFLR